MKLKFDANQPIYLQIIAHVKKQLASGALPPGSRIASVRDLALEYGVNPNTMQKALSELERAGLLYSERTAGRCVTADQEIIEKLRAEEPDVVMKNFVEQMAALGIGEDELPRRLAEFLKTYGKRRN